MSSLFQGLSVHTKRKIAGVIAAIITIIIFAVWLMYSMGTFGKVFNTTKEQGIAVFNFLDQNVEMAYNAFDETYKGTFKAAISTTTATTTDIQLATSTATSTEE
ncbi:MAG: hypothetical protein WC761_05415 [Candidatus Paceibacterota bacterium]|jgi:amino acid permease